MEELIKNIDVDIKRCEDTIKENNYLEIVIAIEEITDKYKDSVCSENEGSNVWRYSKNDLEKIHSNLINYKHKLIINEKQNTINNLMKEISNLDCDKDVIDALEFMKDINSSEMNKDEKWNELSKTLDIIKNQKTEIGLRMLEIISIITN